MCGVPYHSAAVLHRASFGSYRVAICEQTGRCVKDEKLVRREVGHCDARVPPIDPQLWTRASGLSRGGLQRGRHNSRCVLDISTGEFRVTQETGRDS